MASAARELRRGREYAASRHIPELFENLVSALLYYRPDDHVEFLLRCLERLQGGAVIHVPKLPPMWPWATPTYSEKKTETEDVSVSPGSDTVPPQKTDVLPIGSNGVIPHPPTLPKPKVLRRAIVYRHTDSDTITNTKSLHSSERSKDPKPKRKTRAEKREERLKKPKAPKVQTTKPKRQTCDDVTDANNNKLSRRENRRLKQRARRRADPTRRPYREAWHRRQREMRARRMRVGFLQWMSDMQDCPDEEEEEEAPRDPGDVVGMEKKNPKPRRKTKAEKREERRAKQKTRKRDKAPEPEPEAAPSEGWHRLRELHEWRMRRREQRANQKRDKERFREEEVALSYKEQRVATWELKQKFRRGLTLGAYSNLYALLKRYSPPAPSGRYATSLRAQRARRRRRSELRRLLSSGRRDILRRGRQGWGGRAGGAELRGLLQEEEEGLDAQTETPDPDSDSEESDAEDLELYLQRPFIRLDEGLVADCSPSFIRRNHHALHTLCSIEMQEKGQVYLYQENGVISGVGVTGGGTRDEADVTSDYSKKRKSRNGRRKQWVREVEDINHCVKRTRCWGSQRGGRAVIDYYMNM